MGRRPAKTKAQKQYDKQKRALLLLRKTAVRYSVAVDTDSDGSDDGNGLINALTDLQGAANKYTNTLTVREARRLLR